MRRRKFVWIQSMNEKGKPLGYNLDADNTICSRCQGIANCKHSDTWAQASRAHTKYCQIQLVVGMHHFTSSLCDGAREKRRSLDGPPIILSRIPQSCPGKKRAMPLRARDADVIRGNLRASNETACAYFVQSVVGASSSKRACFSPIEQRSLLVRDGGKNEARRFTQSITKGPHHAYLLQWALRHGQIWASERETRSQTTLMENARLRTRYKVHACVASERQRERGVGTAELR
jgi:hypothetical protein